MHRIPDDEGLGKGRNQIALVSLPSSSSKHVTSLSRLLWTLAGGMRRNEEELLPSRSPFGAETAWEPFEATGQRRGLSLSWKACRVKSRASGAQQPGFRSCQGHGLVMRPRASYLSSLSPRGHPFRNGGGNRT